MARELHVSTDVAQLLPAAMLSQVQATIDDPDNVCCACEGLIDGPSAELIVFTDGEAAAMVKVAHSDCMSSGVRTLPGLRAAFDARAQEPEGFSMATMLGLRRRAPRALIFLEPEVLAGGVEEDPLELYAEELGLVSISGSIEEIELVDTDRFRIELIEEGLGLRAAHGLETVPADESELAPWLEAADGRAVVIAARGLGLSRSKPAIEEALALRPSWGAIAMIADSGS